MCIVLITIEYIPLYNGYVACLIPADSALWPLYAYKFSQGQLILFMSYISLKK